MGAFIVDTALEPPKKIVYVPPVDRGVYNTIVLGIAGEVARPKPGIRTSPLSIESLAEHMRRKVPFKSLAPFEQGQAGGPAAVQYVERTLRKGLADYPIPADGGYALAPRPRKSAEIPLTTLPPGVAMALEELKRP